MTIPLRRLLRSVAVMTVLGVVYAVAPLPAAAQADPIDLGACNSAALGQPFLPWADPSSYELAPGGDFESAGWTMSGGAVIDAGSETFAATGALGARSLSLPAGASALSPATCVNAAYPTIRFFIAGTGSVAVGVVYDGVYLPAGVAVATGGWRPTALMLTSAAIPAALSTGTAQVSLRLGALTGSPRVDDVFIDPWNRG